MANDFLNDLGKTLSKTAQGIGKKVNIMYETQKLTSMIAGEQKAIEKARGSLGKLVFEKFQAGEHLGEDLKALCQEIIEHMEKIEELKTLSADKKGQKICPKCKKSVDKAAAFCPYCGTPCPVPEPETVEVKTESYMEEDIFADETGDDLKEAAADAFEEEKDVTKTASEEAADTLEDVFEDSLSEETEDFVEEAEDALDEVEEADEDLFAEDPEDSGEDDITEDGTDVFDRILKSGVEALEEASEEAEEKILS